MNLHKKRFIYPPLFKSRYNNKRISFEICVKRNWIVFKNQCAELKKQSEIAFFPHNQKFSKVNIHLPFLNSFIYQSRIHKHQLLNYRIQSLSPFNSLTYSFKSLIKLAVINKITAPIGKAAMILTDCKFCIELSEKISAIGKSMSNIHHINWIFLLGVSSSPILL